MYYVIKCMLTIPRVTFELAYIVSTHVNYIQCMKNMFQALATVAKSKPVCLGTWEFF